MNRSLLNQKYLPLRKIAAGGMGEIYLARQTGVAGFQREVALKVIHRRLSEHPKAVDMFLNEARLAAALTHPNVVQILDVGEEEGSYFIAMERVRGPSVRELAEKTTRQGRRIPLEHALNIVVQVLEALRYAHSYHDEAGRPLKIVHRDVCPGNVMVSIDGAVKLGDFGIARAANQLPWSNELRPGKFAYMAPEAVRGETVDQRSDLFSVGVLLYELTVGRRLFRGASLEGMLQAQNEQIPPPTYSRTAYPADLELVVMKALEKDPADRFDTAEEMLEQLEGYAFDARVPLSRLRLGRFVREVIGVTTDVLELVELEELDEESIDSAGDTASDELDFDRVGIFEETARDGDQGSAARFPEAEPREAGSDVGPVPPDPMPDRPEAGKGLPTTRDLESGPKEAMAQAVAQAQEALADLVSTSGDASKSPQKQSSESPERGLSAPDDDEGETIELQPADRALLLARSVTPLLADAESGAASGGAGAAAETGAPGQAGAPGGGLEQPSGSTMVVADDQVEEELFLDEPDDDSSDGGFLEPPRLLGADESSVTGRFRRQEERSSSNAGGAGASAPLGGGQGDNTEDQEPGPEASEDLKEALAEISAELHAAEESDRRREEALVAVMEKMGQEPEPLLLGKGQEAGDRSGQARQVGDLGPSRGPGRQDELMAADGGPRPQDDPLELVDVPATSGGRVQAVDTADLELEAEGETIVLDGDDSAIEVEVEGARAVGGRASAKVEESPAIPTPPPELPPDDGLDDPTLEFLPGQRKKPAADAAPSEMPSQASPVPTPAESGSGGQGSAANPTASAAAASGSKPWRRPKGSEAPSQAGPAARATTRRRKTGAAQRSRRPGRSTARHAPRASGPARAKAAGRRPPRRRRPRSPRQGPRRGA